MLPQDRIESPQDANEAPGRACVAPWVNEGRRTIPFLTESLLAAAH